MKFNNLKTDKGVAGLTIFLSVIVMLFVIGLLITIFALMGGELSDSGTLSTSETKAGEEDTSLTLASQVVTLTACSNAPNGAVTSVTSVYNDTTLVTASNYTTSVCVLSLAGASNGWNVSVGNITYTYTYSGSAWESINATTGSIVTATDWFDIFIVISAMVVLILLTVIIITAIRGSGLVATGGSSRSNGNIGSA